MNTTNQIRCLGVAAAAAMTAVLAPAQSVQGPSSSRTPYLQPTAPHAGVVRDITSIVTTTDLVPLTGSPGTAYEVAGILDGLGAYDNGDGTVTVLANHEINTTQGVVRRHGARGTFVSELILDKATLQVVSAQDLIERFVDAAGVVRSAATGNPIALGRFCSSDLPPVSAYFHAPSGLGTQDRIYMAGEEGPATGYAVAMVATGAEKGTAYVLPAWNLATNGSGINAVGAWENILANPFSQPLTVVASTSDGGTGAMDDRVTVYVGQKLAAGNAVERAGLLNGTNYLVQVAGQATEIVDSVTRATNIQSGMRFSLQPTVGTQFSRPEDGAWDPTNPRDFYFVTTDRMDSATTTGPNPTIGATGTPTIGMSRLWRLRFDDIRAPLLGGVIDLLIDGGKLDQKVNMLDNMCVGNDGLVYLTEDPGNNTYLAKVWVYDPISDTLVQLAKMDESRWGELAVLGGTPGAISPHNNNKEISGVIDVTDLFPHAADETVLLIDVQDHSNNPAVATPSSVEGGQLLLMRVAAKARAERFGVGCGLTVAPALGSKPVLGSLLRAVVQGVPLGNPAYMMVGTSRTEFLGTPLPASLDPLGLTGCMLYQDLALEGYGICAPIGAGAARYDLPIPAGYAFTGLEVHLQAWAPSLAANPAGLIVSDALTVVLGL